MKALAGTGGRAMADEIPQPHDAMVRAVLSDLSEASSFLQRYVPEELSRTLNWSTLRLYPGSFVDEDLRRSQTDVLYEVERVENDASLWLYILLEHQSTPDRWMRFRLLKYCCRIWDMHLAQRPTPRELRPIAPLVFYQGERTWSHSTEFADLFAESVRDWSWTPRFRHELIDQSRLQPEEVRGELKEQLMQLLLIAAYHPALAWISQAAALLASLSSMPPSGGVNYIRVFVRYLLSTQEPERVAAFREALRQQAPEVGENLMTTYAQELLAEGEERGEQKGALKTRVEVIEGLLREGVAWAVIERATGVGETQFQALKQQAEEMGE